LVPPRLRMVVIGIIGILVIVGLTDALLFASGRAIVSPFQSISYQTAAAEGLLPLMWFATVVVAPAGEEIMFRGFLFRGFVHSQRAAWPAIVGISLLWTLLHVQYDWTGMSEIFVAGMFLGWLRYKSGSTLLTIVLHGLFNLEGMIETMLQLRHF
jgi:membrane protease YdiL (CAAX protease family)